MTDRNRDSQDVPTDQLLDTSPDDANVVVVQYLVLPDRSIVTDHLLTVIDPLTILEWYHRSVLTHLISQGPTPVELEDRHVEWLGYWTTALTSRLDTVLSDLTKSTPYVG